MTLDIPSLQMVAAIVDAGAISRAAERLFVTQSALSHRLRKLEKRLGVSLFERINRRLVITPQGEQVLGVARRVLAELEAVERELRAGGRPERTRIRLVTECYTAYHWLPPVMGTFRQKWPTVEFEVAPQATANPVAGLLDGSVDVAIVFRHPPNDRVRYYPLFEDELMLVTAPDHRLAGRDHIHARDLESEQLLVYSTSRDDSTIEEQVLRPAGVKPMAITRVLLTEAIVELVKARMGVAVLAKWAVAPQVMLGQLAAVPITRRGLSRRWSAAVLADEATSQCLNDFIVSLTSEAFRGESSRPMLQRSA